VTYCIAIKVKRGLVLASDSRTHAGADHVSTYSKMHTFEVAGERVLCVLTSGNLATSQAVMRRLRRDAESEAQPSYLSIQTMAESAEYIGELSVAEQRKYKDRGRDDFKAEANFIVAGQIAGREPEILLVYPEGNYIRATQETPYLQAGELKYGKPILDRFVTEDLSIELAARCALVSMDSTMRSNATVGPPIELITYETDSFVFPPRLVLTQDNLYLRDLRIAWQEALRRSFASLPEVPFPRPPVRLVDARGDQ
jgi:putative proteasome-type protease